MTDTQLDIENDEIMAEIAFEMRGRREMDAADIAAEQAEMTLAKAEARYAREARTQVDDSALTNYMGH
jgi:hypothetical protein